MKAVLLAGGLGTRLHPLTCNIPKPMVPVMNRPIMAHVLTLLKKYGFTDIIVLLYHKGETIKKYFGNGKDFGVKLTYLKSEKELGTAGSVKFVEDYLHEPFLVISADLITDINLKEAVAFYKKNRALATIALTRVKNPLEYGIVIVDRKSCITQFLEKPSGGEIFSDTINSGIYVVDNKILRYIPKDEFFDFSKDLFPKLLSKKLPLFGYISSGYWKDIGNLIEYGRVNGEILLRKVGIELPEEKKDINIYIGKDVKYTSTTKFEEMAVIGDGTCIADLTTIRRAIIGENCQIGRGSVLDECVIWDNVRIGKETKLRRAVIGKNCIVQDRVTVEEGAVIGDDCNLEKDSTVRPYIRIWPRKIIEEGATVSRSMVWQERWTRGIFGAYGVTGICNVEITPEFAAALGSAFATMIGKRKYIAISRDSHKSSRMINRALVSGALSCGVNIYNLEDSPIPVNRYALKTLNAFGGWHVRKSPYDPKIIDIKFFDENGMDLSKTKEKNVEKLFFGGDYPPIPIDDTGELTYPYGVVQAYKTGFFRHIDIEAIKDREYKIVIDYSFGSASRIFPSILGELGCDVISLNANIDETKITKSKDEFDRSLKQLSDIVKSLNADIGIMFDSGGEKVFLIGDDGTIYHGDMALEIIVDLFLRLNSAATLAVPVTATRTIEEIAKLYKAKVIRSKSSMHSLMEIAKNQMIFVGENHGGFIFPEFQPSFDGMFSAIKILELMAKNKKTLSEIAPRLPASHILRKDISCRDELKGMLIRTLAEEASPAPRDEAGGQEKGKIELIDGIKIYYDGDWVLVLPIADRPVISLYSESSSMEKAQKLINTYLEKVDRICGLEH